ncbi:MAG: alpha/beta fold hydrolase [Lentimicrobiaceae bacterium]|jgi:pimeloyl-ACP methyl ester carboxylesterase
MKLFYREFGLGQPAIILHGLFGQSDNWVTVGRRIADQFHVYIPDQRNHGQSPHTSLHSFPAMADDLAGFIEEHKIENPVLIGHSMGGKVAMTYALENPGNVNKLVVIDISPRRYPERVAHTQIISQMMGIDLEKITTRGEVEKILESRIPEPRVRMFIMKNLYYKMQGKLAWRLNLETINQSMDMLFDSIQSESQYKGPTLFIRGGKSDYVPDVDFPLIKSMFPEAIIKTIPGASHWIHADAPEELCVLLSDFLGRECKFI